MAQVQFKYGTASKLRERDAVSQELTVEVSSGNIYITTDTHSMYVDLPTGKNEDNSDKIERFRIGDFERYKDLKSLVADSKNWYIGSLALIESTDDDKNGASQTPILAYYDGLTWTNINDTTTLKTTLQGNIDKVAEDLSTLNGTVDDNTAAITAIQREIGERPQGMSTTIWSAISGLMGDGTEGGLSLTSLKAAIEENIKAIGENAEAIEENAKAIEDEETAARAAEAALGVRIKHFEDNVDGYATRTEVATAKQEATSDANAYTDSQISAAIGEATDYIDQKVGLEEQRATGVENALRADIDRINNTDTGILAKAKEYTDALANGAVANNTQAIAGINDTSTGILAKAKEYTDEQVDIEEQRALGVENALAARLSKLEGEDAGKSVRQISAAEVAKIVANADQSYDTLKEIADWILNDTTGAADMANDIADLQAKTVLGTYLDGEGDNATQKEYETVKDYVEAIERALIVRITATDNKLNWGTF